jgi:hypothetical protein
LIADEFHNVVPFVNRFWLLVSTFSSYASLFSFRNANDANARKTIKNKGEYIFQAHNRQNGRNVLAQRIVPRARNGWHGWHSENKYGRAALLRRRGRNKGGGAPPPYQKTKIPEPFPVRGFS